MAAPEPVRVAHVLAHDIGKYIARTAHNVRDGSFTPELADMLLADLYHLRGGRPLAMFLLLAPTEVRPLAGLPAWRAAHDALCELDAMEPALRARDSAALCKAARLALSVEGHLRDLVRQAEATAHETTEGSS